MPSEIFYLHHSVVVLQFTYLSVLQMLCCRYYSQPTQSLTDFSVKSLGLLVLSLEKDPEIENTYMLQKSTTDQINLINQIYECQISF